MTKLTGLRAMPSDLDLRWSVEDRRTFRGAEEAWALWHEWLSEHTPTPEQVHRKLLLDLFFDYRCAHHLGADFDTNDSHYEEFNRCTGAPITSMEDYVQRILVLLEYQMNHRPTTSEQLARAKVAFIVHGDPAYQLE